MKCPSGIVVYFRIIASDNQLACSVHLDGRSFLCASELNDSVFIICDEAGETIGMYERSFVAAILPLATRGPSSADLQK